MGRRIRLDGETFTALDRLTSDRMSRLQELADEAFRDLLKKHRRPLTRHHVGQTATGIGRVVADEPVVRDTRIVDMLIGEQLPRNF